MTASRTALTVAMCATLAACANVRLRSPITPASSPPETFVATTSDSRTTRVIDVRDGLSKSAAFHAVSEFLAQKYSVDVSDQHAGFLMTPWQAPIIRDGVPDLRYRARIIARFLGDDWKQLSVRVEANWQKGDEWDVGFDSKMLEDAVVDLRTRVGKKS